MCVYIYIYVCTPLNKEFYMLMYVVQQSTNRGSNKMWTVSRCSALCEGN